MTVHTTGDLIVYGYVGLGLVAAFLGLKALNAGYVRPAPHAIALRRPWEQCTCLGLVALLCLLLPLLGASNDLRFHGAVLPTHWPFLWSAALIGLAGAAFFLRVGKPEELVLDVDQHTYRHTAGWTFFQRQRTGPWSDLESIWAEEGDNYGRIQRVYVRWRGEAGQMVVGCLESSEATKQYADRLASVLGVPCLTTPSRYRQQALHSVSLLERSDNKIVLRTAPNGRCVMGLSGLVCLGFLAWFMSHFYPTGNDLLGKALYPLICALTAGISLLFFFLAMPCELCFELTTRTFQLRHGVSPFVVVADGQFSDVACLYIIKSYNQARGCLLFYMHLKWKKRPAYSLPTFGLGVTEDGQQAVCLVEDLAKELGVPYAGVTSFRLRTW